MKEVCLIRVAFPSVFICSNLALNKFCAEQIDGELKENGGGQ